MDKNFKTRNGKYSESNETFKRDKNAIKKINEKIILENSKGSKYMSGQLCQIIKNGKDKKFEIKTPFGYAKIRRNLVDELVVLGGNAKYTDIVNGIREKGGNKIENIKEIYNYLSTPSDNSIDSIEKFNQKVKEAENKKKIKAQNELAKLSAILMLSEPYRFKDGGGLSRGYIRKAIKDMEGGGEEGKNALNKIFGNEGVGGEPNAPFARRNKNKKTKKRKKNTRQWLGGKKEMEHVLQISEDKIPEEGVDNEKKESIEKNIKQFSEMVSYISDNEDEDENEDEDKDKDKDKDKDDDKDNDEDDEDKDEDKGDGDKDGDDYGDEENEYKKKANKIHFSLGKKWIGNYIKDIIKSEYKDNLEKSYFKSRKKIIENKLNEHRGINKK